MSFSFGNEETVLLQHELLQRGEGGAPIVYPALLSKVAEAFRERVTLGTKTKDSIEYQNAFDGREAVVRLGLFWGSKKIMHGAHLVTTY